ncbi:TetR/AcrR family transcriptional regulator [Clavibacter nebraskensis]|nr:TetR family transcriptional regulator [Clavibacter nebraskensis]KXU21020.1 TetR family transcriptional regulator [Clavibacter nebraskensis]OAH22267.1 TetR family transcriptional regulator [Clavibacter nebraskensis]RIJ18682.1 TetR/AcrR family transcriptional regulator [Clavibacter nebraskensis]UKF27324.1 TetR/AcrR family transcriptional regulator [Clavibacter nebraskensis]CCE75261.1 transcriptional regulator, TetR family [Clavibacter nebraskensis NCPPB 2581]
MSVTANELDARDHGGEDAGRRRRGPRTSGDARGSIIAAARLLFIESGADRVSARRIAASAGVDPSLVRYYFGSLEALLEEALRPSEDLIAPYLRLRELPVEERGAALVAAALHTWEHPVGSTIMRWVTVSSDHDSAAYRRFADAAPQHWMSAMPEGMPAEEADIRNSLVGAALGGIAITRYIWRSEPIASMSPETVIALHGPVVQGFLTGPLPDVPVDAPLPAA